jgi:hypothetical protein
MKRNDSEIEEDEDFDLDDAIDEFELDDTA